MKILVVEKVNRHHARVIGVYGFWRLLRYYWVLRTKYGLKMKLICKEVF